MRRREFLGAVTASLVAGSTAAPASQATPPSGPPRKGRIKQGVTRGVFALPRGAAIDDSCREAARLGIKELNYRFVMAAIADLGFTGFVTHEYTPTRGHDPIAMLSKAIEICDV